MKQTYLNCGNTDCFIFYGVPDSQKKDVKEHHEIFDYDKKFDCKKHSKWEMGGMTNNKDLRTL